MTTTQPRTTPDGDPAATRALFAAITDQRIARARRIMRTAEIQVDLAREALDDLITVRTAITDDGGHVCVVCGDVVTATEWGTIDPHPGHGARGGQCRGTGLHVSVPSTGGGL